MFKLKAAAPTSYFTCGSIISGEFQVDTNRVRSLAAQAGGRLDGTEVSPEAASMPNPAVFKKARRGHRPPVISGPIVFLLLHRECSPQNNSGMPREVQEIYHNFLWA